MEKQQQSRDHSAYSSPGSAIHFRFPLLLGDDFQQLFEVNSSETVQKRGTNTFYFQRETTLSTAPAPLEDCLDSPASATISDVPRRRLQENSEYFCNCKEGILDENSLRNDGTSPSLPLFPPVASPSACESSVALLRLPPKRILRAYIERRSVFARTEQQGEPHRMYPERDPLCFFSDTNGICRGEKGLRDRKQAEDAKKTISFPSVDSGFFFSSASQGDDSAHQLLRPHLQDYRKGPLPPSLMLSQLERFSNELSLLWRRWVVLEKREEISHNSTNSGRLKSSPFLPTPCHDIDSEQKAFTYVGEDGANLPNSSSKSSSGFRCSHEVKKEGGRTPSALQEVEVKKEWKPPRCFLEEMGYYATQLAFMMRRNAAETVSSSVTFSGVKAMGSVPEESITEWGASSFRAPPCPLFDITDIEEEDESRREVGKCASSAVAPPPSFVLLGRTHYSHASITGINEGYPKKKKIPWPLSGKDEELSEENSINNIDDRSTEQGEEKEWSAIAEDQTKGPRDKCNHPFFCSNAPPPPQQESLGQQRNESSVKKEDPTFLISLLHTCFLKFLGSLSAAARISEAGEWVEWWLSFPFLCSEWTECREIREVDHHKTEVVEKTVKDERKEGPQKLSSSCVTPFHHRRVQRAHVWELFRTLIEALRQWCTEAPSSLLLLDQQSPPTFQHEHSISSPVRLRSPSAPWHTSEKSFPSPPPFLSPLGSGGEAIEPNFMLGGNKSLLLSSEKKCTDPHHNSSTHERDVHVRSVPISLVYSIHAVAFHYHRCFSPLETSEKEIEEKEMVKSGAPPPPSTAAINATLSPPSHHSTFSSWKMLHELCEAMMQVITALPVSFLLPQPFASHGGIDRFFFRHCRPANCGGRMDAEELMEPFSSFLGPPTATDYRLPYCALFSMALDILLEVQQLQLRRKGHATSEARKPFPVSSSQVFLSRMLFLQDAYNAYSFTTGVDEWDNGMTCIAENSETSFKQNSNRNVVPFCLPEAYGVQEAVERFFRLTSGLQRA